MSPHGAAFKDGTLLAEAKADANGSAMHAAEERSGGFILSCSPHVSVARPEQPEQEVPTSQEASTNPLPSTSAATLPGAVSLPASEATDRVWLLSFLTASISKDEICVCAPISESGEKHTLQACMWRYKPLTLAVMSVLEGEDHAASL